MRNQLPSKRHSEQNDGTLSAGGIRSGERTPTATVESIAWELRSPQTSATVRCVIEEYEGGHCIIRVTHADNEVISCWEASRGEATAHAAAIETNLLHTGWGAVAPEMPLK